MGVTIRGEVKFHRPTRSDSGCFVRMEISDPEVWEEFLLTKGKAFGFVAVELDSHGNIKEAKESSPVGRVVDGSPPVSDEAKTYKPSVLLFQACRNPVYWEWLEQKYKEEVDSADKAAVVTKFGLAIDSRKEADLPEVVGRFGKFWSQWVEFQASNKGT